MLNRRIKMLGSITYLLALVAGCSEQRRSENPPASPVENDRSPSITYVPRSEDPAPTNSEEVRIAGLSPVVFNAAMRARPPKVGLERAWKIFDDQGKIIRYEFHGRTPEGETFKVFVAADGTIIDPVRGP